MALVENGLGTFVVVVLVFVGGFVENCAVL